MIVPFGFASETTLEFSGVGYFLPLTLDAGHCPPMPPIVPWVLLPNTVSVLPPEPSGLPMQALEFDRLYRQLIEMRFLCALPPLRIQ